MKEYLYFAAIATVIAVLNSGCDSPAVTPPNCQYEVPGGSQTLVTQTQSFTAVFTQVAAVDPSAGDNGGGGGSSGSGSDIPVEYVAISGEGYVQPFAPTPGQTPSLNSPGDGPMAVTYPISLDTDNCLEKARRALREGAALEIVGEETASYLDPIDPQDAYPNCPVPMSVPAGPTPAVSSGGAILVGDAVTVQPTSLTFCKILTEGDQND